MPKEQSRSLYKDHMNKLRVESRGNFESNADKKDPPLKRIKMGKEKFHIVYRKTSNKIRIKDLSNECMNKNLLQ